MYKKRSALCALFWEPGATLTAAQWEESKQDQTGQLDAEVSGKPQLQIFCTAWVLQEHRNSPVSLFIWNYESFPQPGFSSSPITGVLRTLMSQLFPAWLNKLTTYSKFHMFASTIS